MLSEAAHWRDLMVLTGRVGHAVDKAMLRHHGICLSGFFALSALKETEGQVLRVQELSDAVGLTQSTVSRLLNRLEDSGLVRRRIGDHDRRATYAGLTEAGRAVVGEATGTFEKEVGAALAAVRPVH